MAALHGVIDKRLYAVFDVLRLLNGGFGSVHAAGCLNGIAAGHRHLFDNDNVLTGCLGFKCRHHAGAAGANHNDIRLNRFGLLFRRRLLDRRLQRTGVNAR
ncbi:hypothetical protein DSECCO2_570430 [anaerobic digester metagenome]